MENKERKPSDEWCHSSNWDEIVGLNGGFVLGVGYCYCQQFKPFFANNKKNYYFFETKWGRCGTTFLFSALRPDYIIVPSAWANAAVVCGKTELLFRIWKDIIFNLASIKVPLMIVDMPAAWHLSNLEKELGREKFEITKSERRSSYFNDVVKPCLEAKPTIEYIDLQDVLPYESKLIWENKDGTERANSPWHSAQELVNCVGKHFLLFTQKQYNKQKFIEEVKEISDGKESYRPSQM
jgi:hypothetical protein